MSDSASWRLGKLLALCVLATACGGRTDGPGEDMEGGDEGPVGPDPREGGCDHPIELPFANFEVRGRLRGPGKASGYCGEDGEHDGGPEDNYLIKPLINTDVLVFVLPETEFTPTLRVTRDGCYASDGVTPQLCAAPFGDRPFRFFYGEAGAEYTLTIDSPEGTDGLYTLQVFYSAPTLDACPVHPTQIDQEPGGFFTWSNTLGGRAGEVDGPCGGPGAENMFQINIGYPGNITFRLEADQSFAPILSVRTGCGGSTELVCTSMEQTGSSDLELTHFFSPGTYFLVVDQGDIEGGAYKLEAFIE